ncbi:MAG: hypothetical protein ABJE62_13475, partial [Balneola sp.]
VLYTCVTSDLLTRTFNHKKSEGSLFSSTYRAHFLLYYEVHQNMYEAIRREKQIVNPDLGLTPRDDLSTISSPHRII